MKDRARERRRDGEEKNFILTVSRSLREICFKCNILRTVPSGSTWNESSTKACSRHQDTRGEGTPPLDKHVRLMASPSRYGPAVAVKISAP